MGVFERPLGQGADGPSQEGTTGWMMGQRGSGPSSLPGLLAGPLPLPPFSLTARPEAPSVSAPSPGAARSHTPFPAILLQCDKRTMGLPVALPWSCWSHKALTQERLDPRKEGVQILATCQGLSRGDVRRKMAYGLALPRGQVHQTAPQAWHTHTHTPAPLRRSIYSVVNLLPISALPLNPEKLD